MTIDDYLTLGSPAICTLSKDVDEQVRLLRELRPYRVRVLGDVPAGYLGIDETGCAIGIACSTADYATEAAANDLPGIAIEVIDIRRT